MAARSDARMLGTATARRPNATGNRARARLKPAQAARFKRRERAAEDRRWRREHL